MITNYKKIINEAQKALSIYGIDLAIKKECKNSNSIDFMNITCKEARERAAQCLKELKVYTNSFHQSFCGV